jgi:hypothetical protein
LRAALAADILSSVPVTPCEIVRPRPLLSEVHDPAKCARMYMLAAQGVSRRGVAAIVGLSAHMRIQEWIERGLARQEDPFLSFALRYQEAERMHELTLTGVQTQQVRHIAAKHPRERTIAEMQWIDRQLARRYPKEHGVGEGLGQLRQLDGDIDLEAWWQKHGLEQEQLQALLREPPETLALALVAEADALFALLCERGWKPPRRVKT